MPFGLYNSLAIFTTMKNSIFHKNSDESVIVYIDDILIFSKNNKEHKLHLKIVLNNLRNNQLYANIKKIFFC